LLGAAAGVGATAGLVAAKQLADAASAAVQQASTSLPTGPVPTGVAASDTAAVQAAMTANSGGTTYLTNPGTFAIDATVHLSGSLVLGPSTILQASTTIAGPVVDTPVGTFLQNVQIVGGIIDAHNLAYNCLYIRYHGPIYVETDCINATQDYVILGDPAAAGSGYGATLGPSMSITNPAGSFNAGYSNLNIQNSTDNVIYIANMQGAETGVTSMTGDNKFISTHPNGGTGQPMVQCFFDISNSNTYTACTVDTVTPLAHSGATGSASNNVITDAAIKAQHRGLPVTGTHIPAGSYVGPVTAGTSFLLVTNANNDVSPTGTVSGIRLAGVGWNAAGYGPGLMLANCVAFEGSAGGVDNSCYAITVGPGVTALPVSNFNVLGVSAAYRWIAPFTGNTTVVEYFGLQQTNVVTGPR
jgi:hypothetical protein